MTIDSEHSVHAFLSTSEYANEWFCVVSSLLPASDYLTLSDSADRFASWCYRGGFTFGQEWIPVKARTAKEWYAVLQEMCDANVVASATIDDVDQLRSQYKNSTALLPPRLDLEVTQLIIREAGYYYWRKYLSLCKCEYCLMRNTFDVDGACMVIGRTKEEVAQVECPAMEYGYASGMRKSKKACLDACSRETESPLCDIQWCGPYWTDDYNVSPTGYALRCGCRFRGDEEWNFWA